MMEPRDIRSNDGRVLPRFALMLCLAGLVAALVGLTNAPWDLNAPALAQGSIPTPSYTATRITIPTPSFTATRTPVCTQVCPTCPPPESYTPTPTPVFEGPGCCPPHGYPDYSPHGAPDFDMRQEDWYVTSAVLARLLPGEVAWTYSGPAASADAVWWLDSKAEYELGRKYELVTNYGPWYDHDQKNAPPLIEDLARKAQTDSGGTDVEELYSGLEAYIRAQGLEGQVAVEKVRGPSFRWAFEDLQNHDTFMVLLLGFWQRNGDEWVRVGGHWVGALCFEPRLERIQLVDPLLDEATLGQPGWEWGGVPPTYTMHNDAQFVSYDAYHYLETEIPGARWELDHYAHDKLASVVHNSLGQNYGCLLEPYRADYQEGKAVRVVVDYGLAIRRGARCYFGMPTPTPVTPTITPIPDPLRITKTRPYGEVKIGWNLFYYIFVTNTGTSPVNGVTIVDTLPTELAPYSVVPGIGPVGTCNPGGSFDGVRTVTWNLGTLGPGESRSVCIKAQPWTTAAGKVIVNHAVVSAPGFKSREASDSAYVYEPQQPTQTPTRVQYPSATPSPTWGCIFPPCPTCPAPSTPQPTATPNVGGPGICPRQTYPDYAPHGPPDFDMRQEEQSSKDQWTLSGPTAAGDALWWLDSEAEYLEEAKYGLVTSYGPWYDHDPQNVPPLVNDVAELVHTDEWGTSVENMVSGLESYISRQGLESSLVVESIWGPSWDWVWLDAQQERTALVLLLGFWQYDGQQWVRVGGHWSAVCCFSPFGRTFELIDPFFDEATLGFPGREYGGVPDNYTMHNDAQWVSYDDYFFDKSPVPGANWAPLEYGHERLLEVVTNSIGQNYGCMLEQYRGPYVEGEPVHVAVDYAVAIRPGAACGGVQVEPTPTLTQVVPTHTPTTTQVVVPTHTPTATEVVVPTITLTPVPSFTPVLTATPTEVPVPIATLTEVPGPTATLTLVPSVTATRTEMPVPTATLTEVPVPTATLTPAAEPTPTPTNTPVIRRLNGVLIMNFWPSGGTVHSRRQLRGLLP
ncbi:MAG TPA: hypothetical protein PKJ21_05580 [Anaerolineae bacterium]|nr:hypothetical protein [Anaerolineae bacterium]